MHSYVPATRSDHVGHVWLGGPCTEPEIHTFNDESSDFAAGVQRFEKWLVGWRVKPQSEQDGVDTSASEPLPPDPESEPASRPMDPLRRYWPLFSVAAIVLALDQLTKALVTSYMSSHGNQPVSVFGGAVLIDVVHNSGAAFGLFPNQTVLFVVIAVIIIAGLFVMYRRLSHGPIWLRIGLGLVLGGALGNLTDRIRLGYVVDFVDLRWWPVFNLADSCIVTGVALMILTASVRPQIK